MTERQIFTLAVEINDPARLEAFLSQACGADQELRARIDELLAAHNAPDSQFLKNPVVDQLQESTDPGSEKTVELPPRKAEEPDEEELPGQPDLSHIQPSSKPGSIGTLGHYEILSILGHGAFGIVFKAFDEKLHRHVAIKMMSAQIAATSPARKRFLREARAAAAIRHDNVTQVYSVEEEPVPYLVMEFIDGQTLQSKQRKQGPLEVAELLHIGRQIAAGLAAAHEKSLIHRDVKPGNILLEQGAEQKVKITDFGLARAADDASLTRSGMISGTPLYMAPEQALGGTLDGRSDLFSLGSVLYELATGRPPFRAPTTVAVLRRVVDDTPRPMREIIPELPEWFVTIVNRLLEKNPDQRFQSAKEVADLLAKCQAELQLNGEVTCVSGTSPRSGSREASAAPAASGKGLTTSAAPPNAKKPPLKTVLYALFLGLLVISPILFGKHLSRLTSSWFFGSIPTLPTVERAAGLRFDGENDFVQVPVTWDLPQFTIEAFVTPAEAGPHRTVVELTNYGSGTKDERLELFDAVGGKGERLSHAHVMGRSGSLSAFGPQTPGVREHRAIVCDGQEIHYYINGVWQGKRKNQPQDNQLWRMRWLTIGCQLGEKNFFKGDIDQLRISKVARYVDNFSPVTLVESDDATLALYNFEEGQGDLLKDLSGNGLDAKISGATWIHPAQGLQFDGVDDYVEIPGLSWNSNQYTIEAYISQDGGHGNLFQAAGTGGMLHMYLYPKGGGAGISRDQVYANANGPRKGKSRQHLAVVYDGKNLNYFVQGQLAGVKTNVSTAATPMPLDRMMIGSKLQSDPSKPEFFEGRVERLRVSNKARYVLPFTPGELKSDDATLALYDFTTGRGDTVKDVSGRSPDGKIVGATWVNRSGIRQNSDDPGEDGRTPTASATGWHGWPADAPKPAIAPFNSEQAKKHQEEWAAYLKVPVEYTNSIGMKFRLIPPGEFLMGAPQEEIDELAASNDPQNKAWEDVIRSQGPQHRVVLTQPFYVGVHEVTQGQYQRVMGTGPATPPEGSGSDLANHPEKGAVWGDAVSFTIQLSELEKLPASYLGTGLHWVPRDGTGYCLPSESQWEFAARAGTTTRYWSGSTKSDLLAVDWVAENSENRTHAVGERPANPFGLFDVHGNAMEWTESQFDPAEYTKYLSIPVIDPPRRRKSDWHAYVARGGANDSWGVLSISSAFRMGRSFGNPSIAPDSGGFRVVLSVDAVKEMLRTEADTSGKKASQDSPHAGNPLAPTTIWSAPVNLGSAINTPAREANPSLTSDELLLVFTRGEELFEARRASRDEPFAPATKLAGPLPSAKFLTGCLSGNGLQLVLSAIPPGGNAQDVMIATRTSRDEPFGQPVALPQSINAPGEDRHPVLSPDGLILALTSVRGGQQTGGLLIFTRPNPTAEFNPTPTVDARLQGSWSVINSFSSDGRGLLKATMADNVETITWHTRTADSPDWSEGQPLPAPFDAIKFGAPFLSTDGNTIYFHSRHVPDGQGDLDLWMSRRTMKTP